jgi:hypothetical protein
MERININRIEGLSGFRLSHIVSSLQFFRPNTRGQHRPDKVKKAVLRALCDRYPNVWPGIEDIARKASCGTTQTRRALRELEHKDRLILDVNSRPAWACSKRCWYCAEVAGKKGGRKNCTVQYFIMDRKIVDIFLQQKWWEQQDKTQRSQDSGTGNKPNGLRPETQRSEKQNPTLSESGRGQNPTVCVAEPIRVLTENKEPTREREPHPPLSCSVKDLGADYGKFRQEFREWTGMAALDNGKMRARYAELAAKYSAGEVFDAIPLWVRRDDRTDNKQWAAYNFLFDLAEYIIEERREEVEQRPGRAHRPPVHNPALGNGELPKLEMPER